MYFSENNSIKISIEYKERNRMKRKVPRDAAITNNKTPVESMPKMEFNTEFTDTMAFKTAERARISNRIEDEGKR